MAEPWDDWIPGVLDKYQMRRLLEEGLIIGKPRREWKRSLDGSSLNVTLSDEAFEMPGGSVKPSRRHAYSWLLDQFGRKCPTPADATFTLHAKHTYVFKLRERLNPKRLFTARMHGQATAKSSVGRVDVLARLIVDGMDTYESFNAESLGNSNGDMYLEITPITFHVKVRPGTSLSQLRIFKGKPEDVEISGQDLFKTVLGPMAEDGTLSVDLDNLKINGKQVAAFCAAGNTVKSAIPLWKKRREERPNPSKFWTFVKSDKSNRLRITKDRFYLLRSKERIRVPPGVAIYCRASDETIGEMRIHYAGFVHPTFGKERKDGRIGTPLMFEVRGHQVSVSLADGEKMANLIFYRMSKDSDSKSDYDSQELKLSGFFGPWPKK